LGGYLHIKFKGALWDIDRKKKPGTGRVKDVLLRNYQLFIPSFVLDFVVFTIVVLIFIRFYTPYELF